MSDEYKSAIGLRDVYIAPVTVDDSGSYVAGAPIYFAPIVEASAEAAVNSKTQYADDAAYDAMVAEGETTISLTVTGMKPEVLAAITGNVLDVASGRIFDNGGTPPYYAVGFKSQKSNGKFRFYWFLKGIFDRPQEEFASKTDSPEPKVVKIKFTAIKTTHAFNLGSITDGVKRVFGDEDTTNFSGTGWFTQVQTPVAVAPSAIALSSSSPATNATGVATNATVTLTFNNAMEAEAINAVTLLRMDTGAIVATTNTLDATTKIMSLAHSAFTAATEYKILIVGAQDIYGQVLAASAVKFTTA